VDDTVSDTNDLRRGRSLSDRRPESSRPEPGTANKTAGSLLRRFGFLVARGPAAGPETHYFFGTGWNSGSLVGGTMFFIRM
jgi:hypothetical protein